MIEVKSVTFVKRSGGREGLQIELLFFGKHQELMRLRNLCRVPGYLLVGPQYPDGFHMRLVGEFDLDFAGLMGLVDGAVAASIRSVLTMLDEGDAND